MDFGPSDQHRNDVALEMFRRQIAAVTAVVKTVAHPNRAKSIRSGRLVLAPV